DGAGRRQPGDPPAGVAGERSEGVVRVADDSAGNGEHAAEFGAVQGHEDDENGADGPRQDRGRASHAGGVESTEEPTRSDDRADSGEQQSGLADIALETSVMNDCHARMRARDRKSTRLNSSH